MRSSLPTIVLLYALMVVSAQLRLGGFYTRTAFNISSVLVHPRFFLLVGVLTSAALSAVLASDIICRAFTPVFTLALQSPAATPSPSCWGWRWPATSGRPPPVF